MPKTLRSLLVVLVIIAAYIGAEVFCHYRTAPPSYVQTLDGYLRWRPDRDRFLMHSVAGKEFLEALGPGGGVAPSGPAGYVFDRSGKMVDWTHDSGDDSEFQQKWRGSQRESHASRTQADEWVRATSGPS